MSIAAVDFNGDGWLDIVAANSTVNGVTVLENNKIWPPAPVTPPPAQVYVSDASIKEGGKRGWSFMEFTVILSAAVDGPVTVEYATQNGSATTGSDYLATSGYISFAEGETTKTIRVTIAGDTTVESDESFQLVLSNLTGNAAIADGVGIGVILNDDVLRGGGKKSGRGPR